MHLVIYIVSDLQRGSYILLFFFSHGVQLIRFLLEEEGIGLIQPDQNMWREQDMFIIEMIKLINLKDNWLQIHCKYAGSTAEVTKVGMIDELDIQMYMTGLDDCLTVVKQKGQPSCVLRT